MDGRCLLIVSTGGLSFGCVRARHLNGDAATIVLYEDLRHRYVDIVPSSGDCLVCENLHTSVFAPISRVDLCNLCVWRLPIPYDVLASEFPVVERLRLLR